MSVTSVLRTAFRFFYDVVTDLVLSARIELYPSKARLPTGHFRQ